MILTKTITVFDSAKVVECLKDIFGDRFNSEKTDHYFTTGYTLNNEYLYVRLNNNNSFSITIHNDINSVHVSIRRKWTSIHEDIAEDFELLNCDLEDIIRNFIANSLEKLNNVAKMSIQTTSSHTITYSTY